MRFRRKPKAVELQPQPKPRYSFWIRGVAQNARGECNSISTKDGVFTAYDGSRRHFWAPGEWKEATTERIR